MTIGQMEYREADIISLNLDTERQQLEVIVRIKSNMTYPMIPPEPAPDYVFKDIFRVANGKIEFVERIEGKHTPPRRVPEQVEFPEYRKES